MEKEILTPEFIQKGRRSTLIGEAVGWAITIALMTCLLVPYIIPLMLSGLIFRGLCMTALLIAVFYFIGRKLYLAVTHLQTLPKEPFVVIAKRVPRPKGQPEQYEPRGRYQTAYCVYFEKYGRYDVPATVYGGAGYDPITSKELWECTMPGDEFYLVLDGKHQILAIYQCSLFEYTGPLNRYIPGNRKHDQ